MRVDPNEPTPRGAGIRVALVAAMTALCAIVPLTLGLLEPTSHVASRDVVLPEPRDVVYARLAALGRWTEWNPYLGPMRPLDARRFETRPDADSRIVYVLVSTRPGERVVVDLEAEPRRLGARWTFELRDAGDGTRVHMTEHGWTSSPSMRFIMRYVAGYDVALAGLEHALLDRGRSVRDQAADGTSPP